MVAIAAAAHALDGLAAVKPFIDPSKLKKGTSRHRQILEAFKHGFRVGPNIKVWAIDFEWLFDLRDAIVHDADEYRPASHG